MATTLNEMLGRLEAGLRRERAFVADASHELRTPLATMKTELELVAVERPAGEALDRAISAAIADTDRLALLTEDLLLLARADLGQASLSQRPVSAPELLKRVAERYPGADVVTGAPPRNRQSPPPIVSGHPGRLERALTNMVDNALRHGAPPVRLYRPSP